MPKANPRGNTAQKLLIWGAVLWFALFLLVPLFTLFSKVFQDKGGAFIGLENFRSYFATPSLVLSIGHSFEVSIWSMGIAVVLAFLFAYGLARCKIPCKNVLKNIALLPLFVPTMVHAMGLISIFGRAGIVTRELGLDIGIYGKTGIIMAEIFYVFPQAFLILTIALESADFRLYEAAAVMGSGPIRTFFRVTLPGAKYGLMNAAFVCFTLCFTDFGAPQVIGGNYAVLSTDVYKQVVGQQNMPMGSVVGVILTLPAIAAFFANRFSHRKGAAEEISSKAIAFRIQKQPLRDMIYTCFMGLSDLLILFLFAAVFATAFSYKWPQNMAFSLRHFDFDAKLINGGSSSFMYSLLLCTGTALLGTIIVFITAYLTEKTRPLAPVRSSLRFCSMLPMALPGLVIGLSYIMFFNKTDFSFFGLSIPNPLHGLYRTVLIMILSNIVHMFAVTYVTATTSLKKLDKAYEDAAESMAVPPWKLFLRVTVPLSLTAVIEVATYFFVNAMITVSAIVFLYTPDNKPAALAILNMDDNADYAAASAMSICLLGMNLAARLGFDALKKRLAIKHESSNKAAPVKQVG
ncbi:MAG: putative 2-aminoethylphosphonate ABC transporter permease subunit [Oscillospiraceae bacterium]|nr:putative 2-aminoethylphosphonate ABC transporter permease subunit [Oscillospiraceae bacterium]